MASVAVCTCYLESKGASVAERWLSTVFSIRRPSAFLKEIQGNLRPFAADGDVVASIPSLSASAMTYARDVADDLFSVFRGFVLEWIATIGGAVDCGTAGQNAGDVFECEHFSDQIRTASRLKWR